MGRPVEAPIRRDAEPTAWDTHPVVIPRALDTRRWVRRLVLADAAAAVFAVEIAAAVRFTVRGDVLPRPVVFVSVLLPLAWCFTVLLAGGYDRRFLAVGAEEFRRVVTAGLWLLSTVAVASYALNVDLSRAFVAVTVPLVALTTLLGRSVARHVLHRRIRAGVAVQRVVVVGARHEVAALISHVRRLPHSGIAVVAMCVAGDAQSLHHRDGDVPVIGHPHEAVAAAARVGADAIAVAGRDALSDGDLRRLAWSLEGSGIELLVAPAVTDIAGPRILVRPLNGLPLLHVAEPTFTGWRLHVKSALDRLLASVGLVLLGPVLLTIAVLIKVTSRGPAIYPQTRVGKDDRIFTLYKFRTMVNGADRAIGDVHHLNETGGPLFKARTDPRVTRVGRFLRRHSLDELPQLWNVLVGDMSLVGPRPPLPAEVERYEADVHRRMLVKPGVTGLWQVSGRSDLSWDETVHLDLHYVENWSVALDMLVMLKTLAVVVTGRGAY